LTAWFSPFGFFKKIKKSEFISKKSFPGIEESRCVEKRQLSHTKKRTTNHGSFFLEVAPNGAK
jgi:CRISPR/Cas system CSM-associated protein Csm4 (group 5 of RAMP superfamily)